MKKQYLVQVQSKKLAEENKWMNVMMMFQGKRFANTLEEAREEISKAIAYYDKGVRTETNFCGLGVSLIIDEESAEKMKIIKARIRVREVTEWEEVEAFEI